jgi:hypothetical protein
MASSIMRATGRPVRLGLGEAVRRIEQRRRRMRHVPTFLLRRRARRLTGRPTDDLGFVELKAIRATQAERGRLVPRLRS